MARGPCAVPVLARGTGGTTGTAARAETRCGRGHIAPQRFCIVLSIMATSGAGLVAQRGSQRPAMAIPLSWHCLGPRDMPFVAKRSRHVAVAIPGIRDSGHRHREPAPAEPAAATARPRASPDPHRLAQPPTGRSRPRLRLRESWDSAATDVSQCDEGSVCVPHEQPHDGRRHLLACFEVIVGCRSASIPVT